LYDTYGNTAFDDEEGKTVELLDWTKLVDSGGKLLNVSTPVNGYEKFAIYGSTETWNLLRQFSLDASNLTYTWFTNQLWVRNCTYIQSYASGSTSISGWGSEMLTASGIIFADTSAIEAPIEAPIYSQYSWGKPSNSFTSLDKNLLSAIASIPQATTWLGTDGKDLITGASSNEVFVPLGGADSITMGGGEDLLILASTSGNPMVTDFSLADDKILLSNKIYPNLSQSAGALDENNFAVGNPKDSNDFILYNQVSGGLFYDADGNGTGTAIQIATLGSTIHPALTASSFIIG